MKVECRKFERRAVGRLVKASKLSHSWQLALNARPASVALFESLLSGKVRVEVDGFEVFKRRLDGAVKESGFAVQHQGQLNLGFRKVGGDFTLRINGRDFEEGSAFTVPLADGGAFPSFPVLQNDNRMSPSPSPNPRSSRQLDEDQVRLGGAPGSLKDSGLTGGDSSLGGGSWHEKVPKTTPKEPEGRPEFASQARGTFPPPITLAVPTSSRSLDSHSKSASPVPSQSGESRAERGTPQRAVATSTDRVDPHGTNRSGADPRFWSEASRGGEGRAGSQRETLNPNFTDSQILSSNPPQGGPGPKRTTFPPGAQGGPLGASTGLKMPLVHGPGAPPPTDLMYPNPFAGEIPNKFKQGRPAR